MDKDFMGFKVFDILNNTIFEIPKFQRGISWTKSKRKKFIKNFKDNLPIGTILVSKNKPGSKQEYKLIDGLQRISTLYDYAKNFHDYATQLIEANDIRYMYTNFFIEDKKYINNSDQEKKYNKFESDFKDFFSNQANFIKDTNNRPGKIYEDFACLYKWEVLDKYQNDFRDWFYSFINNFRKQANILDEKTIFGIVYNGEESRLPEIFENINTGAVCLSKYEIFAAQWIGYSVLIKDDEILTALKDKYDALATKSGLEIQGYDGQINNEISIHEYCCALGVLVQEKAPHLFKEENDKSKINSIGFEILCLVLDLSPNSINRLPEELFLKPYSTDTSISTFLVDLKNKILEAAGALDSKLGEYFKIPKRKKELRYQRQYLFLHMIKAYCTKSFVLDVKNRTIDHLNVENKKWLRGFRQYAIYWLLDDIFTGYWSINRQLIDLYNLSQNPKDLDKYGCIPSDSTIEDRLSYWIQKQNEKKNNSIITNENKIFLATIHNMRLKKDEKYKNFFQLKDIEVKYDFEHIAPKNRIKHLNNSLPISAISNLCFMSLKSNRGKQDSTLYEVVNEKQEYNVNKDYLYAAFYPEKHELSFLKFVKEDMHDGYKTFLKDREHFLSKEYSKVLKMFFNN